MVYFEIYLESFGNFIVGGVDFIFILDLLLERVVCMLCGFILYSYSICGMLNF